MVSGSLVSNKQSVNPSIISAHPVYESQRTRDRRAQMKTKSPLGHTMQMVPDLLAQLARERRTPAPTTGERNIRRSDNLFLDRIFI
jgi:hypothetical protein